MAGSCYPGVGMDGSVQKVECDWALFVNTEVDGKDEKDGKEGR